MRKIAKNFVAFSEKLNFISPINQPNIFRVLKNMSLLTFFFQEAQLMPTNVLINFSAKFCRRVWKMFLLHKTRWEVFFGRNSGMYVLKKEKTFGVLNGFLFTQVYWIRVKSHLLTVYHIYQTTQFKVPFLENQFSKTLK